MQIEVIQFKTVEEIKFEMTKIGVSPEGIALMWPKYIFLTLKLKDIRNVAGNILKQEMLSLGGDAALHADTVNCRIEKTDVLLGGTLRHYSQLIKKLKIQVAELKEIGREIDLKLENLKLNNNF